MKYVLLGVAIAVLIGAYICLAIYVDPPLIRRKQMTLYYLDPDPQVSARMMTTKYIPRQLVLATNILASSYNLPHAFHRAPLNNKGKLYGRGPWCHPWTTWSRESMDHWCWILAHACELNNQHKCKYVGDHFCQGPLSYMSYYYAQWLPLNGFRDPPNIKPRLARYDFTLKYAKAA